MRTWRHPRLPPRIQRTFVRILNLNFKLKISHLCFRKNALNTGQSRLTLVTTNEGCARYPTEGNNSSHELTTAMQHLPTSLARALVS